MSSAPKLPARRISKKDIAHLEQVSVMQKEIGDLQKQVVEASEKAKLVPLAIEQLRQSWSDLRLASKMFGQHDWIIRRYLEICDVLEKFGEKMDRSLNF